MLKAGTAIMDITPKKGVQLAGYPHCPRENEGVHDPLYASALYLKNGEDEIMLLTVDLLTIGKNIVKEVRSRLGMHVSVTATHTHSGPWASEPLASELAEGICQNAEYIAFLTESLIQIAQKAKENLFDAEVGTGIGHCGAEQGIGGNRRSKDGITDNSVNVLAVRDISKTVRAILVNYSLHPTYLHAENLYVTADYPGAMRRYFHYAAPEAVFMFAQGTSGDQSSRYFRTGQNFEEAVRAGTTIACEAFRVLQNICYTSDPELKLKSVTMKNLPMKVFPDEQTAYAAKLKAEEAFEKSKNADYITMRNAELAMFGAQNTYEFSRCVKSGYVSPELPSEVVFIKIGDTLIVALQGELFVRYGLEIKRASSYEKTFVFGLSNGYAPGYIYTPEAAAEGGYETGTSMFAPDAGETMLKIVEEELHNV